MFAHRLHVSAFAARGNMLPVGEHRVARTPAAPHAESRTAQNTAAVAPTVVCLSALQTNQNAVTDLTRAIPGFAPGVQRPASRSGAFALAAPCNASYAGGNSPTSSFLLAALVVNGSARSTKEMSTAAFVQSAESPRANGTPETPPTAVGPASRILARRVAAVAFFGIPNSSRALR